MLGAQRGACREVRPPQALPRPELKLLHFLGRPRPLLVAGAVFPTGCDGNAGIHADMRELANSQCVR